MYVYPSGMECLDIWARKDKQGRSVPKPQTFQSILMSDLAPKPQATSTSAVGAPVPPLASTITNEKTIASAPREDQKVVKEMELDVHRGDRIH